MMRRPLSRSAARPSFRAISTTGPGTSPGPGPFPAACQEPSLHRFGGNYGTAREGEGAVVATKSSHLGAPSGATVTQADLARHRS